MRDFIDAGDVARLLDLPSADAFLARRAALEDQGFPLPCPWSRRPLKWRADQVLAWRDRQGLPRAADVVPLRLVGGNAHQLMRAARAR